MIAVVKAGICENTVTALKEALEKAENGEIHNVVIVADNVDGQYCTTFGYNDIGVLLGRIQVAQLDIYSQRINNNG